MAGLLGSILRIGSFRFGLVGRGLVLAYEPILAGQCT